jgi:hypothetical protein
MIKINLLKENSVEKNTHRFPKSFGVIFLAFIAIAVTIFVVSNLGNRSKEPPFAPVENKAVLPETTDTRVVAGPSSESSPPANQSVAEPAKPLPADTPSQPTKEPARTAEETSPAAGVPGDSSKNDFSPSTHASDEVIEEVVHDRSGKNGADLPALSYNEMSQGEKINYEIAFTKKIFGLLTRVVPEGIEFSSLTIDSFTVIKAIGIGSNRELVGNLFRSLRNEKILHLRDRPISSIRPLGGKGYRFDFSCEASFGVDTSQEYLATSNLKPHESFNGMLKAFSSLVSRDGITLEAGLDRIATEKTSRFRRYTYHMSGGGTYLGFVKLVLDLQQKRLPCSFNRIQLKARSNMKVAINADVVFTLQD